MHWFLLVEMRFYCIHELRISVRFAIFFQLKEILERRLSESETMHGLVSEQINNDRKEVGIESCLSPFYLLFIKFRLKPYFRN